MTRTAAGVSPEELSLQDALQEGQRAGWRGTAAGLNPYQCGTPEYAEWERGRRASEGARLDQITSSRRAAA